MPAASGERSCRWMAAPSGGHNRFCEAAGERPEVEAGTEEMEAQVILSRDWKRGGQFIKYFLTALLSVSIRG